MIKTKYVYMIAFLLFSTLTAAAQDSKKALQQRVSIHISKNKSHQVLWKLASQYGVPIGVEVPIGEKQGETDDDCCSQVVDGYVEQALNAFIDLNPSYKWAQTDGVVNVSPKIGNDPLLDIVIRDFKAQEASAEQIVAAIAKAPEVAKRMAEMSLELDGTTPLPQLPQSQRATFSVELHNTSVREILNHMIRTTSKKYWIVYRSGDEFQFIAIRLL
jgi:hypothetical protein